MRHRSLRGAALAALFVAVSAPAAAQRANENALASAEDAFGSSVGNERVGLYNPGSARGFSPIVAGNVRIEGMYFDLQGQFPDRLISGSTMRVGLTAQGHPFIAPTGIADFSLRPTGGKPVLSTSLTVSTFGGIRMEADGHAPISGSLSLAAGASYEYEELHYGPGRTVRQAALIGRWRPSDDIEVIPFWSIADFTGNEAQPIVYTAGSFLPPKVERRKRFTPDWADNEFRYVNYGLLSTMRSGAWTLRGGVFRSITDNPWSLSDISLQTDEQGFGDRSIIAEADRNFASSSGELRVSRLLLDGERRHNFHLTGRGREQKRRYGGGQTIFVGRIPIDRVPEIERPEFSFGPQTHERVRQLTAGIGYQGLWPQVGELSLGLQKTSYRKGGDSPAGELPVSRARPWLMNGTLSIHAGKNLALYAGYAKGLEESPVAPARAVNRDEAPPAIITRQKDAGLRYAISDSLRLVAGLFEIEKPYFALDTGNLYRNLGSIRNRGVELSLAGQLVPRLNALLGLVLMDPEVRGDAVEQGIQGKRPIDSFRRYASAGIEYSAPWGNRLSFDLRWEHYGNRAADRLNSYTIPARHVVNLGGRYRFDIGDAPSALRIQWASLTNHHSPVLFGEGFIYNVPARLIASLTTDW